MFTAIGILQLVEQGILSLDTRLSDCLDHEFPYFDENVIIHHLLTHSSGIPDYFDEEVMDNYEQLDSKGAADIICSVPIGQDWSLLNLSGRTYHKD